MGRITQADIANALDISIATVSMALNGKGNISDEQRELVIRTAGDLGYIRRTSDNRSRVESKCMAILSYLNNRWFYLGKFVTPIYAQIEAVCLKNGYYPIIIPVTDFSTPKDIRETILQSQASGVFSVYYYEEWLFKQIKDLGFPILVVNNSSCANRYHTVCVDDYQGAYEGTQYLLSKGHRNIVYMDYWRPDQTATVADRYFGFKRALEEHSVPFDDQYRITCDIEEHAEMRVALKSTLLRYPEATAIFAHDDRLAIQVISALKELKYNVPGDISIVAPGDTLDYKLPYIPNITTLRIDTNLLGSIAATQMIDLLKNPSETLVSLKVSQTLMERDTVKAI